MNFPFHLEHLPQLEVAVVVVVVEAEEELLPQLEHPLVQPVQHSWLQKKNISIPKTQDESHRLTWE